jgi:predicted ATPase
VDSPFFPFLREARGAGRDSDLIDAELTTALREPERKESLNLIRDRRESLINGFMRRALIPDDGTPLLLCFEDAHWSDPSSLEVLTRLLEAIERRPVLVVVTGRDPDGLPEIAADVTLTLRPLSVEDSRQIVAATIGQRSDLTPDHVIAAIAGRADGIPFFAEELALSFAQATTARGDAVVSLADVPASLQEALQYRVDGLEVGADVLELAAVFGRELPMDVLEALVPGQRAREAALEELSAAGLLTVTGVRRPHLCRHSDLQTPIGTGVRLRHDHAPASGPASHTCGGRPCSASGNGAADPGVSCGTRKPR